MGQEDGFRQKKSRPNRAILLTSTLTNITKKTTPYRVYLPYTEGAVNRSNGLPLHLNKLIELSLSHYQNIVRL